jgi:FkbM family methyltransferase
VSTIRQPRFSQLKKLMSGLLCSNPVGLLIGWMFGDEIPFCGLKVSTRSNSVPAKNKASLFFGVYESAERRFVNRYLVSDLPVIELGSSIGGISSHIARRLKAGGQLICVEANPRILPILHENLSRNASHLNFQIVHGAVHYDAANAYFEVADNPLDSSVTNESCESSSVPAVRLGSLVDGLENDSYQLVSDIEGAELGVVRFDVEALRRCRLAIIEFHDVDDLN